MKETPPPKVVDHKVVKPEKSGIVDRTASAIDSAIYFAFPGWGNRRRRARAQRRVSELRMRFMEERLSSYRNRGGGSREYYGAKNDYIRSHRYEGSGLSPDTGLENDLKDLQVRCADLYKNNSIAHSAIEGRVTNEVGCGIGIASQVMGEYLGLDEDRTKRINEVLEMRLKAWSQYGVDRRRQSSWGQLQKLVCRSFASHGEAFVLLGDRATEDRNVVPMVAEVIAPERVETPPGMWGSPKVRAGVEFADDEGVGEVVAYHVRTRHPRDRFQWEYKYDRYPVRDSNGQPRLLHIFDPLFPAQSRGIPWLAASMNRLKDLDDFMEAELIAKQIEACFGLIFEGGNESESPLDIAEGTSSGTVNTAAGPRRLEDIQPGMIHYAQNGEEVKVIDPNRPGASFAPFIEIALRSIAGSLNYPYELLAKNFFRTTFSSGQLAMLDGRLGFRMRQHVLVEQLLCPVWSRFVFENVFMDEVDGLVDLLDYRDSPMAYSNHVAQPPGWGYVNPRDDVRANSQELEDNVTTMTDVFARKGKDFESEMNTRFKEKSRLIEDDVKLRKMQWDLEESSGIPHAEEQEEEDESNQPAMADD